MIHISLKSPYVTYNPNRKRKIAEFGQHKELNFYIVYPEKRCAWKFQIPIFDVRKFGDEGFSPWFRIPIASVYKSIDNISYMLVCNVQARAPAQHFDA